MKNHIKEEIYTVKLVGTGQEDPTTSPIGYAIALYEMNRQSLVYPGRKGFIMAWYFWMVKWFPIIVIAVSVILAVYSIFNMFSEA